jgi:hypothetical protein
MFFARTVRLADKCDALLHGMKIALQLILVRQLAESQESQSHILVHGQDGLVD